MLQPAASAAADTLVTVITDSLSVATAAAAQPEPVKELSVWDLCMEGGFIMIPLLILALISIYIFIERAIVLRRAARDDAHFMSRIKDYIHHGDPEAALRLCNHTNSPYARLIAKGITRIGRPMNDVLPTLVFLGTVMGMVQAFYNLASAGSSANIDVLAGGIYEALVTTVAGLIVGIVALFAYNYLVARINGVMTSLEGKTMEFMDLLNEPVK